MAKVSTANWYVVPHIKAHGVPLVYFVKTVDADKAEQYVAEKVAGWPCSNRPVVTLDAWCEAFDLIAAAELQFALGLLPEHNCSEGHVANGGC